MLLLRSLAFNVFFYLYTLLLMIGLIVVLVLPGPGPTLWVARVWSWGNLWALRVICGMTYEMRGVENVPPGGLIVAAKHQSAWETFALITVIRRPAYILKKELMYVPLFGWLLWKAQQVPVDRGRKGAALASIVVGARRAVESGQQVMIFPEGTRKAVDAPPDYKFGVVHLYQQLGVSVQPVALNSGLFWRRRSIIRRPGKVLVEFLPPIPPGLSQAEFTARLQEEIETASNRLVAESRATGLV